MEKESIVAPVSIVLDAGAAARQLITSEIQYHPGYADLHNRLGLLEVWSGRPERAARAFREALGINPGYFWAAANLGFSLLGAGKIEQAIEVLSGDMYRDHPAHARVFAALLLEAGQPDRALDLLEGDDADNPTYVQHTRGLCHLRLGDVRSAQRAFEKAAVNCRALDRLYRQRELIGPSALERMSPNKAADPIRVFPGLHELFDFFAEIYARHGFRSRALQCYEEGEILWPDPSRNAWNLGRLASWLGESEAAKTHYVNAIAHNDQFVDAHVALGSEHASDGEILAAIQQFERAAELRPGYADIRYQLGLAYMDAQRFADACDAFRAALSINPSFSFARMNLALALRRNGDRIGAVGEYERLLAEGRATADLYMNLGLVHLDTEDFVRAEDMFREGIEISPDFPLNYYHLGVAYQRQGREAQARTAWKQFLDRNRESELTREVEEKLRDVS
jgi:tetratricopeptide (TPR) repeat protein